MPDMDGFELAEALRRRGVGWPVLLITSDSGGRLDRRAAQLGFAGVLQKPLDADRLDEALASAFADLPR
jgi:CheY-like chemotaxis protein